MADTIQDNTTATEETQSIVTGIKTAIDNTWSVLSFVLSSENEWLGYDSDEA